MYIDFLLYSRNILDECSVTVELIFIKQRISKFPVLLPVLGKKVNSQSVLVCFLLCSISIIGNKAIANSRSRLPYVIYKKHHEVVFKSQFIKKNCKVSTKESRKWSLLAKEKKEKMEVNIKYQFMSNTNY